VFGFKGVSVNGGLPAGAELGVTDASVGATSGAVGVTIVNGWELEVPTELETVTAAEPGKAVSDGVIAAVSCVALTNVVARPDPFQFTTVSFVKFIPVTVRVSPAAPQKGVDAADVVEAESEVTAGGVPSGAPIWKSTMFDTSVVVVLFTLDVAVDADPGICTATLTVPAVARSEAGTGAVSWMLLTSVVVSGAPFHRINAPVVNPCPFAVIVKPWLPAEAVLGLTNVRIEEEVWTDKLVL
jgi:hypothetical protein